MKSEIALDLKKASEARRQARPNPSRPSSEGNIAGGTRVKALAGGSDLGNVIPVGPQAAVPALVTKALQKSRAHHCLNRLVLPIEYAMTNRRKPNIKNPQMRD